MKHDKPNFILNIVIPTYRRNHDLFACIKSILTSHSHCAKNIFVHLSIFDNDPDNKIENKIQPLNKSDSLLIHYIQRKENIGVRKNIVHSLLDAHKRSPSDAYVFVSDDDTVEPNFISSYIEAFTNGADAVLSACYLKSYEERLRPITIRQVPTRKTRYNIKIQFIFDSRLLSGCGYSSSVVNSIQESEIEYIEGLWYPMKYFAAMADSFHYIYEPTFTHIYGNQTYWDEHKAYDAFFIQRINMYHKMSQSSLLKESESTKLIKDFIGHQSLSRILRLFITKPYYLKYSLSIGFIYFYKNLLLHKTTRCLSGFFNRLSALSQRFHYI